MRSPKYATIPLFLSCTCTFTLTMVFFKYWMENPDQKPDKVMGYDNPWEGEQLYFDCYANSGFTGSREYDYGWNFAMVTRNDHQ